MPELCEGCGERPLRWSYSNTGRLAGRWLCHRCKRRGQGLKRLAAVVTFRFRIAEVLPADDPMTVPVLRLLMAIDDVRRAQIYLLEAQERLIALPPAAKYLAAGDFLYSLRLLFSHLDEGGTAIKHLDTKAKKRVDALLRDKPEAQLALGKVRAFFQSPDYDNSLVSRIRDTVGAHYKDSEVSGLVAAEVKDGALLESVVADMGGLARLADPIVRAIMAKFNGGDLLTTDTPAVEQAIRLTGHFITFVDHLFDALMRRDLRVVEEQSEAMVDIPPLLLLAGEACEAARRRLKLGEQDV